MSNDNKNTYDDSAKGGFTYEEKLALVADEKMDPKEIGLTSADDARLAILPEAARKPVFGTTLMLRCGVVPIELRAEWAYQEQKIVMSPTDKDNFLHSFMEENKNEFPVQGDLVCGNMNARFARSFKDPILGLAQMMRLAADMLEAKYTEEPAEVPALTDAEKSAAATANEPNTTAQS